VGVPGIRRALDKGDINERLKTLTQAEVFALNRPTLRGGGFLRWNGSPYYHSKIPDLIGIKERRYGLDWPPIHRR
jgi:hypothetical protein